jgi:hypothetical protein
VALRVRESDDEIGNAAVGTTTFQRALEQVEPISSSRLCYCRSLLRD